ncbi:MAG: S8 family serine peptidase, partial [Cyanobacteria bacterium NC_groundwater_1444_Ag_S-0.65um_54_12]|nr:S8 family serine peptidase [Cyanobacteria bacterium NC_groundwater_1444_Ag_S-0.65um_54_12]
MPFRKQTLAILAFTFGLVACGKTAVIPALMPNKVNPPGQDIPTWKAQDSRIGAPEEVIVSTAADAIPGALNQEIEQFTFKNRTYHLIAAAGKIDHLLAKLRDQGLKADQNLRVFAASTDPLPSADPSPVPPIPPMVSPGPAQDPDDEFYFAQWGLQQGKIPAIWPNINYPEDMLVAVIDTGVDYTHPDLAKQIIPGPNYVFSKSWWQIGKRDPGPLDDNSHGTHVAGIITASANNRIGMAGVAPGCKVMAIKALAGDGTGDAFNVMKAVSHAINKGAKIVNLSLGSAFASSVGREFFGNAVSSGALLVAAAGNEGDAVSFPASYPGVLSVGAVDAHNNLASFSNHDQSMGLVAPGVGIISTVIGKQYAKMSGTSMA